MCGKMSLKFTVLSWEDIISMSMKLASLVKESGFKPDYLIGVARGGLVPLRILSDLFNNNKIFIINVKLYKDIEERSEEVVFVQEIDKDISNHKVLIVDDVADTGITLKAVVDYIKNKLKPSELKVATIHYKPWSAIKPDYYLEEVTEWIVYPWEYIESINSISKKLENGELSGEDAENAKKALEEIKKQLDKYDSVNNFL